MFLTRIKLNLRDKRVLTDMGNAQDLHRTVMSAFPADGPPDAARASFGVLHRVDVSVQRDSAVLYVQSSVEPNWGALPHGYAEDRIVVDSLQPLLESLAVRPTFAFRLRANPTRKIGTSSKAQREAGARSNGRRVPVREEEHGAWLAQKGSAHGFRVLHLEARGDQVTGGRDSVGWRRGDEAGRRLTHRGVLYDGILEVLDSAGVVEAVRSGIGPAKAYGFGLLSLASPEAAR